MVRVLLHGVADKGQRRQRPLFRLAPHMREHLGDLRMAAPAVDLDHEVAQGPGICDEGRGAALADAAEIDELDGQTADGAAASNMSACTRKPDPRWADG
jgi:hypothetical protein